MVPVFPSSCLPAAERYLELLDSWNRTHALTALPKSARFEELLLDAAALLPALEALPEGAKVVDFGTGMGVPAIPLALARPDLWIEAIDASSKKIAFVRQAALELRLPRFRATHARAERLPRLEADAGTAKAVGDLDLLCGWWSRHGKAGAPFFAFKGPEGAGDPLPPGWGRECLPYALPTRGERTILVLRSA